MKPTPHKIRRALASLLSGLLIFLAPARMPPARLFADIIYSSTWDFSVDLPEGFEMIDAQDDNRYLFEHREIPVTVLLRAYGENVFGNPEEALTEVLTRLGAQGDIDHASWRNADTVIGSFSMLLGNEEYFGWAVAARLSQHRGIICSLTYAPAEYQNVGGVDQFIISCADSLNIDRGSYREAGPITAYAFPAEKKERHTITIGETPVTIPLDTSDAEADAFVVEREYAVLTMYATSPWWKDAWQRYYRQVFRNASGRLKGAAFAIQNALFARCPDNAALAQELLAWVQGFQYERSPTTTDFTPVTKAMLGQGSDCDSRALLLAALLNNMGIQSSIFVSREFSHALLGVQVDALASAGTEGKAVAGAKINTEDGVFLLGETTAPVKLGLVAKDMADSSKWIYVPLFPD